MFGWWWNRVGEKYWRENKIEGCLVRGEGEENFGWGQA